MPRLYRPHIPLEVRCRVAERQLSRYGLTIEWRVDEKGLKPSSGERLSTLLKVLAAALHCEVEDLRLDHDPALATRMKRSMPSGITAYSPDANSPDHLIYREKHAHHIKTNVRGDHGQHPDRVLIKRERKRQRDKRPARPGKKYWQIKRKLQSRPQFAKGRKLRGRKFQSR